jgi:hypothetical protein
MKKYNLILIALVVVIFLSRAFFLMDKEGVHVSTEGIHPPTHNTFVEEIAENVDIKEETLVVNERGNIVPPKPKSAEEFLVGRTFWDSDYKQIRVFFKTKNNATLQLFRKFSGFNKGTVVNLKWYFEGHDGLCFVFPEPYAKTDCYRVALGFLGKLSPGYADELDFIFNDNPEFNFTLNRQAAGNFIFKPEIMNELQVSLYKLRTLSKDIYNGWVSIVPKPVSFDESVDATTRKYLTSILKNIWGTPWGYFHFREDGTYSYLLKGHIAQYAEDAKALKARVKQGKWSLFDDKKFCFVHGSVSDPVNGRMAFCAELLDAETVLMEPREGFITHGSNGFSVHHSPENLIHYDQFEYFDLLK